MSHVDKILECHGESVCQRCGHAKAYHKMIVDGKAYLPCIRKKPYKLADGVDVVLGMQVWSFHPYVRDPVIITGMVRFISSWGSVSLWKYPEDRDPNRIFDISHEGLLTAHKFCYSTLENAQMALDKKHKCPK